MSKQTHSSGFTVDLIRHIHNLSWQLRQNNRLHQKIHVKYKLEMRSNRRLKKMMNQTKSNSNTKVEVMMNGQQATQEKNQLITEMKSNEINHLDVIAEQANMISQLQKRIQQLQSVNETKDTNSHTTLTT